jgi:hypothetical protein
MNLSKNLYSQMKVLHAARVRPLKSRQMQNALIKTKKTLQRHSFRDDTYEENVAASPSSQGCVLRTFLMEASVRIVEG